MKKKEALIAIALATSVTAIGCASQDEVNSLNAQVSELQAQVTELQNELSSEQSKSESVQNENANLEAQAESLQNEIESLNEELENAVGIIESAETTTNEMSINVTKYAEAGSTVYSKPEEKEENKIADLEMNTECYVVANFSGLDNEMWSAVGALKTTDENGDAIYQIITSAEKGEERIKNNNIDYFFRKMTSITVDGKTIKADDLAENQEIRIVYARTSLLSNSKVTEQQKTSAEKSSTPKQSTPQQTAPADDGWSGLDGLTECIAAGCPSMTGMNIQFN